MFNQEYEATPARFYLNLLFGLLLLGFFAYIGFLLFIIITDQMVPKDRLVFLKKPQCVSFYLTIQCPDTLVRETRRSNWRSQFVELKDERNEYFEANPIDACFDCIE